jgi:hypothetical protein
VSELALACPFLYRGSPSSVRVHITLQLESWLRYSASFGLLQFAEDPEQLLASAAQAVEHLPAATMRLDELCGL